MASDDPRLILAELAPGLTVRAEHDGVWVRGRRNADSTQLALTRLGRLLDSTWTQLLESGLANEIDGDLVIPFANFVELAKNDIDVFDGIVPDSPFTFTLESGGWLGGPNFHYQYRFYWGARAVHPRRVGCFVGYANRIYRLNDSSFALLEAVDGFNAEPPEAKAGRDAFICFAKVKGLATNLGAQLDRYIRRETIVIANHVGLNLVAEPDGRISFAPRVEGAPDETLRQAFFASEDAETMYSLADGEGGRLRVILDEQQREVLRRMQRVRHLGGAERAKVLRNPHTVFDGVGDKIDIDPEQFGPRVKGIGDFPFVVQPYVRLTRETIFDAPGAIASSEAQAVESGLECRYADGSSAKIVFTDGEAAARFRQEARKAWLQGRGVVEFEGKSIALNETLIRALDEQRDVLAPGAERSGQPPRRYLLIHTNEEAVEFAERELMPAQTASAAIGEIPRALRADRQLKEHQKEGLTWLQRCFNMKRRGCLLADDMGLGKTLQVLTFLAWLIEQGALSFDSHDPEAPPWDPILIVVPLVLLENEVWQKDMREFFVDDGSIFQPWLVLRGQELNRLKRKEGAAGAETIAGLSLLDVTALRKHRVIFTNYETIKNYQFSFARRDLNWSVVITDEAQEYKTPNTKISHALKALTPRFRVACTGTPVETRLRDVWNIFDFLQPGDPLASVSEFTREFEEPYRSPAQAADAAAALGRLRAKLKIGRDDAWIMRRDKRQRLPGLPEKKEHELTASLSDEQRRMHLEVMKFAGARSAHPLELLNELTDIYQHPALRPRYEGISAEEAIARCPKLAAVMTCLDEIRGRGEKALIFARRKPMQQLLKAVVEQRFSLTVDIINGDRAGAGDGKSRLTRAQMLDRFRSHPAFDVLVLSPVVAGLGLTLIEANHVIHYGRWWNPALEAQATDRVYRIGQTRPVHVYYPIAVDPLKEFTTFDEKLARIIQRRRAMAEDFLTPLPAEQEIQNELLNDVLAAMQSD